ncbi:MAG: hypothetical protein KDB16_18905 [Acidimicrobiales bacterium]|nr:hypothetical protein [Acidimicrobiales bacterium]
MSDIDSEIADAAAAVEAQHSLLEPAATELVATASQWGSEQWERIVGKVVAASPDLVRSNQTRLPALKDQLRGLQDDAADLAAHCLEPWLLHRSHSAEQLLAFAGEEPQSSYSTYISLPRGSSGQRDEPLRRLAGAIGPALQEAGILTDKSEVDASGRYRYALPDEATVKAAVDAYETELREFIRCLRAHAALVRKRDADEATQLWRDA